MPPAAAIKEKEFSGDTPDPPAKGFAPCTLILPAIFPYLVTGLLTASGGAWNASIVSEYVQFGNHTVSTLGLGASIAEAVAANNFPELLAATLLMALFVVVINRLVWKRLYALAERRYTLA